MNLFYKYLISIVLSLITIIGYAYGQNNECIVHSNMEIREMIIGKWVHQHYYLGFGRLVTTYFTFEPDRDSNGGTGNLNITEKLVRIHGSIDRRYHINEYDDSLIWVKGEYNENKYKVLCISPTQLVLESKHRINEQGEWITEERKFFRERDV